jgi:hypothetical protein
LPCSTCRSLQRFCLRRSEFRRSWIVVIAWCLFFFLQRFGYARNQFSDG